MLPVEQSRARTQTVLIARFAGMAAAAALSGAVHAQDALGSGRALDNNLRQGSGGYNSQVRDVRLQGRLQNAIVTGNAAGSASFRGSLGYTSEADFRGITGSDDMFRFERDAFNSGLAARNVRSIDALKQQMQFSTGYGPSTATAGALSSPYSLSRPAAGVMARDLRPQEAGTLKPLSIDPFAVRPGSLRSTSDFLVASSLEPNYFASGQTQDGQQLMIGATPLRGIVSTPVPAPGYAPPTRTPTGGAGAPPIDIAPSPKTRLEPNQPVSDRLVAGAQADTRIESRLEPARSTYDGVMERLLNAYKGEPPEGQAEPAPVDPADPNAATGAPINVFDTGADNFVARLDRLREEMLAQTVEDEAVEDAAEAQKHMATAQLREEVASLLGNARPMVSDLAVDDGDVSYQERMGAGQRMLADGFWFDAEERFVSALSMRPGDPMASIGRVHAAMGAGLYRSAAANITQLFQIHPELAAVQYDAALLPREARLTAIQQTLRDAAGNRDDLFARDAGLLLAYLGHQTGSSADVQAGFAAIDRIDAWYEAPADPLVETLRVLWLGEGDAPAE